MTAAGAFFRAAVTLAGLGAAVFAVFAARFRAGFGGSTCSRRAPSERGNISYQEP